MSAITSVTAEDFTKSSTAAKAEVAETTAAQNPGQVTKDAFLQLLVAELTHQDPTAPMDNTQMVNQMAQMQTLEEQIRTREAMENMSAGMQLSGAANLQGKYVTGTNTAGSTISGVVASASMKDNEVSLVLTSGQKIAIGSVTSMQDAASSTDTLTPLSTQMANANSLLGMYVYGSDDSNLDIEGVAMNIKIKSGTVYLGLNTGKTMALSKVSQVYPVIMDDAAETTETTDETTDGTTETTTTDDGTGETADTP